MKPVAIISTFALAVLTAVAIENPVCEMVRPDVYRIDYQAAPDEGKIKIFASSRPDSIDTNKPVAKPKHPPVEVSVPDRTGRVYFHLQPKSGPTRVVSIRRLPLEGATNFRDLGGYRTTDGHYVRWGLVYRSNQLSNLTAHDYVYLNSLGIRVVCDVRTEGERTRFPTQWQGRAPEFLSLPIGNDSERPGGPNEFAKVSVGPYDRIAIRYAEEYATILRRIAGGDLPAVEHCSGGKDRTGIFSAILLTILGVPRDTVTQDYLLSTRYTLAPENIAQSTRDVQQIFELPTPPEMSLVRAAMGTSPEKLQSVFDGIQKEYGSFDRYVRDGLKLSEAEVASLRQRLLQP